jgi:hypothetical protein
MATTTDYEVAAVLARAMELLNVWQYDHGYEADLDEAEQALHALFDKLQLTPEQRDRLLGWGEPEATDD